MVTSGEIELSKRSGRTFPDLEINSKFCFFRNTNVTMTSDHVGCRLDFFLSLVSNFFLVLSVSQYYFSLSDATSLTPFRPSALQGRLKINDYLVLVAT